jgi:hypothetical protein
MELAIRLLRKSELDGTLYLEFAPHPAPRPYWAEDSVYIDDERFTMIAAPFVRHAPQFDPYGVGEVSRDQWLIIIEELQALRNAVAATKNAGELPEDVSQTLLPEEKADDVLPTLVADVTKMIDDFVAWVTEALKTTEVITVIGI